MYQLMTSLIYCLLVSVVPVWTLPIRQGKFLQIHGVNVRSTAQVAINYSSLSKERCAMECLNHPTCEGFNLRHFIGNTGDCEILNSVTRPSVDLAAEVASFYFQQVDKRLCPDQSVCHLYGHDLTWDEALEICPKLHPGTHLLNLRSSQEERALRDMIAAMGLYKSYWVGARRPAGAGVDEFYWYPSGEPVTWAWWDPEQPSPDASLYDCVVAVRNWAHKWNDGFCGKRERMYFCQF